MTSTPKVTTVAVIPKVTGVASASKVTNATSVPKVMRAVRVARFGCPTVLDVLTNIDVPKPTKTQVKN